jgi:hypothetical protein
VVAFFKQCRGERTGAAEVDLHFDASRFLELENQRANQRLAPAGVNDEWLIVSFGVVASRITAARYGSGDRDQEKRQKINAPAKTRAGAQETDGITHRDGRLSRKVLEV